LLLYQCSVDADIAGKLNHHHCRIFCSDRCAAPCAPPRSASSECPQAARCVQAVSFTLRVQCPSFMVVYHQTGGGHCYLAHSPSTCQTAANCRHCILGCPDHPRPEGSFMTDTLDPAYPPNACYSPPKLRVSGLNTDLLYVPHSFIRVGSVLMFSTGF